MVVNPAAGPLTLSCEPLSSPVTIPPAMPAIIPEKGLAPEAKAIPRHSGSATSVTTMEAGTSLLTDRKISFMQ
jgi:hypothetical protein